MDTHVKSPAQLRPPRPGRLAFTLVELLVVVAIIALLAMLMVPSVGSVLGTARSTQCGSRLKEIGKAMTMLRNQPGGANMMGLSWQSAVREHLGDGANSLTCPQYAHLLRLAGIEEGQEELQPIPLEDLAAFKINGVYFEDLGRGPMVVKLSDAKWNQARNDNYLNNSAHANNFPRANYEDGSEDSANPYWLCLEDYGNDWDYKDAMVRVTITGEGYLLEAMSGGTGHQNYIVDKPDHNELQYLGSNIPMGTLEPIIIATGGFVASYGMNIAAPKLNTPGGILVMDYNWLIATPNDVWSDYPHPGNSTVPVFARHRERINVVFMDGSVRMMDPDEINPDDIDTEKARWLP
jgi:prepilin-type N-terminal cleavage/methylation domain-containing protein/prepilin-type processing-associated H-X9-DG protein